MMEEMLADLKALSNCIGVSGFESKVRDIIKPKIEELVDEVLPDPLGNLLAVKRGTEKGPRILLDAHMDEVGFIVSHIDERGFIRFEKIGGWDDRNLLGHPIRFETKQGVRDGLIGTKPPHLQKPEEKEKVVRVDGMFVDVGALNAEEVRSLGIEIGSPFTIFYPFRMIDELHAMGKAFDDRVGCAIIIDVLRRLAKIDHDATIAVNFAIGEEAGKAGATTGSYSLEPDMALAIEGTAAGDIPGIPPERCPTEIGKGPAITVADKSLIAHREVVTRLKGFAEGEGIPYQIKKPLYGGTDAARIAVTRSGVPSGVLSVPCRYIHNGLSLMLVSDMRQCADLTLKFCKGLG